MLEFRGDFLEILLNDPGTGHFVRKNKVIAICQVIGRVGNGHFAVPSGNQRFYYITIFQSQFAVPKSHFQLVFFRKCLDNNPIDVFPVVEVEQYNDQPKTEKQHTQDKHDEPTNNSPEFRHKVKGKRALQE